MEPFAEKTRRARRLGGRGAVLAAALPPGVASLVVLLSLVTLGLLTEPYGRVQGGGVPPLAVEVLRAKEEPSYRVRRGFVGVVEARREGRVGFELGGRVADVLVEEGGFVKAGEAIARLDVLLLESERERLVAIRDQARAAKQLAELTRKRVAEAVEKNAVSVQQWDEADKNTQAQHAALARAEAAIRTLDVRLAKSTLRAPFDALIAERLVDEGRVVEAGFPVVHLLESVHPEVRIGVAGASVDAVVVGQEYELEVRDRLVGATVKAVLPVRGNGTRSVDVVLTLHAGFNGIRHGDLATLRIERREAKAGFWLPLTALTESSRGLWACYVAEPLATPSAGVQTPSASHCLRRRELEVLHQEVDRVFVRGTLEDGALVVSRGLQRLTPDQEVRLAENAGRFAGRAAELQNAEGGAS